MRRNRSPLILGLVVGLLLVPLPALAMRTTVWNFLDQNVDGDWMITSLDRPLPGQNGLHVTTSKDGYMLRSTADLSHRMDAVTISLTSRKTIDALLLWHPHGAAEGLVGQIPFTIHETSQPENINVTGSGLSGWDPRADMVGIGFPAGTDVTILGIGIHHWNPYEKMVEFMKGFWTFDTESSYSINFLWGPLISTNPVSRQILFRDSPPHGHSATWIFYALIATSIAAAVLLSTKRRFTRKNGALIVLGVAATCWFVFDLRMSLEYWSYVINDVRTYVTQPLGQRDFRNFDEIIDVTERSRSLLERHPTYGLVTEIPQVLGIIRYHTYPSLPILWDKAPEGTTDWLVLRSDAIVDDQGRLSLNGAPFTKPGSILERFDARSFFFRTNP